MKAFSSKTFEMLRYTVRGSNSASFFFTIVTALAPFLNMVSRLINKPMCNFIPSRAKPKFSEGYLVYGSKQDIRNIICHLSPMQSEKCQPFSKWFLSGFNGPLRQYFSLYRAVSQREGERKEVIDERKMSKQPPPAPIASAIGPCLTIIQISRTPRHWKVAQHLRTTRPPPLVNG